MRAVFAPSLKSNEEAFDVILEAIEKAGYIPNDDILLAVDVASSEMFENGKYKMFKSDGSLRTSEEMIDWYIELCNKYPIISIEDGLDQNDWGRLVKTYISARKQNSACRPTIYLSQNPKYLVRGIKENIANSILIKVNQIGTLSETLGTIQIAQRFGYNNVIFSSFR